MQILTLLLMVLMFSLAFLEVLDRVIGAHRPAVAYRGLNCLWTLRLPQRARPQAWEKWERCSTASSHYRVLSPSEILFIGRKSFGRWAWPLTGRVLADGET